MIVYYIVKILHIIFNLIVLTGWIVNNKLWLKILLGIQLLSMYVYVIMDGCWVTRLEHDLYNKARSLPDIYLPKLGVQLTKENRRKLHLSTISIAILITVYKIYN